MAPATATKSRRKRRELAPTLAARGGLIAVGGPPYGGKSALASRLAECLPRAVRVESTDNVARASEKYHPDGVLGLAARHSLAAMLETVEKIWAGRRVASPPTIILCARLATPAARRKVYRYANVRDMRFLYVEAHSAANRALRRLCLLSSSPRELDKHLANLTRARAKFKRLSKAEAKQFRCARVNGVLKDLDAASQQVLRAWRL